MVGGRQGGRRRVQGAGRGCVSVPQPGRSWKFPKTELADACTTRSCCRHTAGPSEESADPGRQCTAGGCPHLQADVVHHPHFSADVHLAPHRAQRVHQQLRVAVDAHPHACRLGEGARGRRGAGSQMALWSGRYRFRRHVRPGEQRECSFQTEGMTRCTWAEAVGSCAGGGVGGQRAPAMLPSAK